jgi:putative addiction module component (TIGR02574 family)
MTLEANRAFEIASSLSVRERAALATRILKSLEDEEDSSEVEKAWEEEVSRRIRQIDEGNADMIPWEEVRKELHKIQDAG